jgi:hypothetical protein
MDTDKHGRLWRNIPAKSRKFESMAAIGCAFEVINEVGHGLHEKPYEKIRVHPCLSMVKQ